MRLSNALLLVALLGLALPAFADEESSSAHATVETDTVGRPRPVKGICSLPAVTGPCKAAFPRYYYDKSTKSCKRFIYGGCGGNANNFKTKEECEKRCSRPSCICPKIKKPVCGFDGKTYDNECLANCAGVKAQCNKACPCKDDCFCIQVFDPVCGVDGKTYGNDCEAGCAGVKVDCKGECPCKDDCICPAVFDPVCGVDGKTYGNSCEAECDGVKVACKGECPCKPQCDKKPIDCVVDPCRFAKCPAFPDADCVANRCTCTPEFFVKGKKVDCTLRSCIKKDDPCGGFLGKNGVFTPRGRKCCDKLECCVCFPRPLDIVKPIPIKGFCGTNCPVCKG